MECENDLVRQYSCEELSYVQAQTKKTFCNRLQHAIHIIVDLDVMIHKKTLRNSLDHKHEFHVEKGLQRLQRDHEWDFDNEENTNY